MQAISFQQTIAVSGTAQSLPSNPVVRSVTITAPETNRAAIVISDSPNVTAGGFILEKGENMTISLQDGNTNAIWMSGLAGDVLSVVGA